MRRVLAPRSPHIVMAPGRAWQDQAFIETFPGLGGSAQPMPFPEVCTALATGVVDGQANPLATIPASKVYEVQDWVMANHIDWQILPYGRHRCGLCGRV
ncbi:MAG: hypothetical protein ACREJ0_28740 [Geminicoccaceae bacterium]